MYIATTSGCEPFDIAPIKSLASPSPPIFVIDEKDGAECDPFVRVLNAVEAGAAGVILLAYTEPSNPIILSVAPVPAENGVFSSFSPSYWQNRIRVPVGRVNAREGKNLLDRLRNSGAGTEVELDFSGVLPKNVQNLSMV